jgi:hypothetical protein
MPDPSILFDGLIALLLIVAIGFAVVLDRRLSVLRDSKGELERLVGGLHSAVDKAQRNLAGLRETAESAGRPLQDSLEEGSRLRDELAALVARAESAADRIEQGLESRSARPRPRPVAKLSRPTSARNEASNPSAVQADGSVRATAGDPATGGTNPAHNALIKALKGVR